MPADLLWTPLALEDLFNIYVTIGLDNAEAAERIYTAIANKAGMLVEFPRMGPRRPEISAQVRMLVEGPYLILYEHHPDTDRGPVRSVEIVRIVDGRRELSRLF